jgi:uncharacterized membrane protein YphA (DoxX/SURF4 family)
LNLAGVLQIVVALGLLNVWLLRYSKQTVYRGQAAKNLKEEFAVYGLPNWFHYFIGVLKVGSAIALLIGLWFEPVAFASAALVSFLMVGALAMHFKVHDPLKKYVPATAMLLMSLGILGAHFLYR